VKKSPAISSTRAGRAETAHSGPAVSVVIAAKNEAEAIGPLLDEIEAVLDGREAYEIIVVDDGSTDTMLDVLAGVAVHQPHLRVIRHKKSCGQSAGVRTGVLAAEGRIIVTLDGDGQNDPADVPALLEIYRAGAATSDLRMVAGQRVKRRDVWIKRVSSKIANGVRSRLLRDSTPDTGCGLKVFDREAFLRLPWFDHMHRFLPALMLREGYAVVSAPVGHRPRSAGVSKYGTWDRLWVGIVDILGVAWLQSRAKRPEIIE